MVEVLRTICAVVIGAFVLLSLFPAHSPTQRQSLPELATPPLPPPPTLNPVQVTGGVGLTIKKLNFSKDRFGAVELDRITIENWSSQDRKDVTLECIPRGKSGTGLRPLVKTIYDVFPAKAVKTLTKVPMGYADEQAVKMNCEIANAK